MVDIKSLFHSKGGIFLIISLLCAVVLLFVGSCTDNEEGEIQHGNYISEYEADIENRLKVLISSLDGVSDVEVMVVLECGDEYIYAQNTHSDTDGQKNEYFTDDDTPLLLKEVTPKVKGVAVVCKGGDDYNLQTKIIDLVSRSLELSSGRIFVGA